MEECEGQGYILCMAQEEHCYSGGNHGEGHTLGPV